MLQGRDPWGRAGKSSHLPAVPSRPKLAARDILGRVSWTTVRRWPSSVSDVCPAEKEVCTWVSAYFSAGLPSTPCSPPPKTHHQKTRPQESWVEGINPRKILFCQTVPGLTPFFSLSNPLHLPSQVRSFISAGRVKLFRNSNFFCLSFFPRHRSNFHLNSSTF